MGLPEERRKSLDIRPNTLPRGLIRRRRGDEDRIKKGSGSGFRRGPVDGSSHLFWVLRKFEKDRGTVVETREGIVNKET